ncbi:polynucleotide adenylyltransferase PcnB [Pleionea sp. CnH1-48]|uniref:polynucleotide adenylyltransferase PcnB n=1 Tax=Pleionea sp. CnH1-48 TaxID=2954494 RepID=UPI0020975917|nr:polynucleotide adenylyltransferase PcnB [Pleionea sp. CnH1-48]MCO7227354.1 polynucleotide adenylyltransferase PcnB [Pleionea sp. CnH1-48]
MLKQFWQKLFGNSSATEKQREVVVVPRSEHNISRQDISVNALKVLNRLRKSDYDAYLVGGGVRDILLGFHPKDFDIATNATPEQIKRLFRNCRIIGRRFKLAHILFGHEIIEVATFRASHNEASPHGEQSESGMLVRDNVYGSIEDDAWRRDFTVNALYYSINDFSVIDFTGGLEDLRKGQLRLIGDPITRYREDPVRMLRAIRLAAKLGLKIEEKTAEPIFDQGQLLTNVSAARLWDESHKLLLAGKSHDTFLELKRYELFKQLFPATQSALDDDPKQRFIRFVEASLQSTDKRIAEEKPVTPAFLFSVFLWAPLKVRVNELTEQGMSKNDAYHKAMTQVLTEQSQFISIPRRFSIVIREIWSLQPRLENRSHRAYKLLEHPRFRAAYDFLVLRAVGNEQLQSTASWWTRYQEAPPEGQRKMTQALTKSNKRGGKRRYNRKRKPNKNPTAQ